MALKNVLNADEVAGKLAKWLPRVLQADGAVELGDVEIPQASGMSSETVLLRARWVQDGVRQDQGLVIRVPPEIGLFPGADLRREIELMRAVGERSSAPIPRVLALDSGGEALGAPCVVMERAHGRVPADDPPFVTGGWVVELEDDRRASMWDNALRAIAEIGSIDPVEAGLVELALEDDPGSLTGALQYWRDFYGWAAEGRDSPLLLAALDQLTASRPDGGERRVVSWGDARFGNLMFAESCEVTAVLDWEMATIAPPEVDLGYFLFFDRMYSQGIGVPRLPGFPEREQTVERFEELSGQSVHDLDWYEAWAALRGSMLLLRVGNLMIKQGQMPADAAFPVSNPASHVLAELLDLPAPEDAAGWISGHR